MEQLKKKKEATPYPTNTTKFFEWCYYWDMHTYWLFTTLHNDLNNGMLSPKSIKYYFGPPSRDDCLMKTWNSK